MLFKKCSTSSEGCQEKFGKPLKRAFRAFANNVRSAIVFIFKRIFYFSIELECDNKRENEFVIIVCGKSKGGNDVLSYSYSCTLWSPYTLNGLYGL